MELILLIVIAALAVISIVLSLVKGNNHAQAEQLQTALRQQMQENREELNRSIRELRMEMTQTLNQNMQQLQDVLHKNMMTSGELQRQKFDTMARQQEVLIKSTEKRLDDMRLMVEEKLQKTLNERIGQSFEIVRSQLENVQKGLGEMKSLAQDVGGLKKVLSNVNSWNLPLSFLARMMRTALYTCLSMPNFRKTYTSSITTLSKPEIPH